MAKFGDITEFFDPGLELRVKGKDYRIPLPSAELGLWCRAMAAASELDDDATDEQLKAAAEQVAQLPPLPGNKTIPEHLLGDVYQQMVADKVEDPYIDFCARTVTIWILAGEAAAERFWKAGGRPEARGPDNRASRRANAPKTSTGAASATPSPASTSGTSSQSRSGSRGRGRGSRGRRS